MATDLREQLEARRRDLRMPMRVVAKRSKINLLMAYRVLRHRDQSTNFAAISAIAKTLHVSLICKNMNSAEYLIRRRAKWKARKMADAAQGTAALEGQAVSMSEKRKLERLLIAKLISGPSSELWG